MGVPFGRQVECGVGGIQVFGCAGAVGQPGHVQLAEDGVQPAVVPGLDRRVRHLVHVAYLGQALFPRGAQVQVVLHQLTQQLPTLGVQAGLQLGVLECPGLLGVQERHHLIEPLPRGGEHVTLGSVCHRITPGRDVAGHRRGPAHRRRRPPRCAAPARSAATPASAAASSSPRARV